MKTGYQGKDFSFFHIIDDEVQNGNFALHFHNDLMEILVFLEGDADFHIEGNVYPLEPMDIIIASSNELHRVVHRKPCRYERIVINISTSFFTDNKCEMFERAFVNKRPGEQNLIKHEVPESQTLHDIIGKLQKYAFEDNPIPMIVRNTLIEFLYILNSKEIEVAKSSSKNNHIRDIILYINENITGNLDLDVIADRFFMSKYHLCHIFKKHTGFTVNQYITRKRITLVKDLCEQGKSLTFAASEAGFKSYSSFYRAYLKENGASPKTKS